MTLLLVSYAWLNALDAHGAFIAPHGRWMQHG